MRKKMTEIIPPEIISNKIFLIRGKRVMLDRDLAALYGVETRILNQAVKRNSDRFPGDFMCELKRDEIMRISQIVTSSEIKYSKRVHVFTQEGVAMLSSVLNSKRAIQVNIQIMRAFVKLRVVLSTHKDLQRKINDIEKKMKDKFNVYDKQFEIIFNAFEELKTLLIESPKKPKRRIGFHHD